MSFHIAIDGGTTNTRLYLLKNGVCVSRRALSIGAGANAKTPGALQNALKEAIATLLCENKLHESDVESILASGMLTSEIGLFAVPHLIAPVSFADLCDGMKNVSLPEITAIPFWFVPGVKTEGEDLSDLDMMRGEESELVGLFDGIPASSLVLLPGSHSKIILTDAGQRITAIKTMLTGEMLAVLANETVLRGSFSWKDAVLLPEKLEEGFLYAEKHGLGDALFKVRVLKMRCAYTADMLYSFYLGAVLCDEVKVVLSTQPCSVYIGGREQLKTALAFLISSRTDAQVVPLSETLVGESTARGLFKIYSERKVRA